MGPEYDEYCDNRFLDAREFGRCKVDRRVLGEVINGGSGGWFGFEEGEVTAGGDEGGGDDVSSGGGITAAILLMFPRLSLVHPWTGLRSTLLCCWDDVAKAGDSLASKPQIPADMATRTGAKAR